MFFFLSNEQKETTFLRCYELWHVIPKFCSLLMIVLFFFLCLSVLQGFFVSLFYCFLNSEVRTTLKHRFNTWRDERNIRIGQSRQSRRYEYHIQIYLGCFYVENIFFLFFIFRFFVGSLNLNGKILHVHSFLLRWCKQVFTWLWSIGWCAQIINLNRDKILIQKNENRNALSSGMMEQWEGISQMQCIHNWIPFVID